LLVPRSLAEQSSRHETLVLTVAPSPDEIGRAIAGWMEAGR
jgi:hypothetical protein